MHDTSLLSVLRSVTGTISRMPSSALVTGATGLLGRQVVKVFDDAGWKSVGTGFTRASPPKIRKVDIRDENNVVELLDEMK